MSISSDTTETRSLLDKTAVVLSAICLLHCLALPVLLTLLPVVNIVLLSEHVFHGMMLAFILPVSVVALSIGCREHKNITTIVLGVSGLAILTFCAIWGHDLLGMTGERIVTSVGGITLALAHIQNYRVCRRNNCAHN